MTKPLLAAVLILFALMFASVAFATNTATVIAPVVVKAAPVAPIVQNPTVASVPASSGAGAGVAGGFAMAGVSLYFWAVICVKEKAENADGWFAKHMCFRD